MTSIQSKIAILSRNTNACTKGRRYRTNKFQKSERSFSRRSITSELMLYQMADANEIKFGTLQTDNRYKKLQRALKIANLRKEYSRSSRTSISSINTDADHSTAVFNLQTSGAGSVVVSSSNNLKNILLRKEDTSSDHRGIVTSSVKRYDVKAIDKDCIKMPPPSFYRSRASNIKKKLKTFDDSKTESSVAVHSDHATGSARSDGTSDKKTYEQSNIDVNKENQDPPTSLQMLPDKIRPKRNAARVFSNWTIELNDAGDLIIVGAVDCGKFPCQEFHNARSKGVGRRLTATCIESLYKHIYHLKGCIDDAKNELPDYVRDKFYNGFPDDWQNVRQIWRAFVVQGCLLSFRWPTPITDSDNDLKSEITDITFLNSAEKRLSQSPPSEYLLDVSREENSERSRCELNIETRESFTQTSVLDTGENLSLDTDTKRNSFEYRSNCKQQENVIARSTCNPKTANKLADILKEDKLNSIINNLTDKNCSKEYIDKIIEMFDCVNYVFSYRSVEDSESSMERSKAETNKNVSQESYRTDETEKKLQESYPSESIPIQENINSHTRALRDNPHVDEETLNDCHSRATLKKRNFTEIESDECLEDFESETYAGIRKLPIERILRDRHPVKSSKHKMRKKMRSTIQPKYDNYEKPDKIVMPETIDDFASTVLSVSFIEDKAEFAEGNKFIHSKHINDHNYLSSNSKVERWKESNVSIANNEAQTHLVQRDLSFPYKQCQCACNIADLGENGKNNINKGRDNGNSMRTLSCNAETVTGGCENPRLSSRNRNNAPKVPSTERKAPNPLHSHCQAKNVPSKPPKPVIIDSRPVDIKIKVTGKPQQSKEYDLGLDIMENEMESRKKNDERVVNNNSMKMTSPPKRSNMIKDVNPTTIDINMMQDSDGETKMRQITTNCFAPNDLASVQKRLEISGIGGSEVDCNPRSLTSWTPKVLSCPESSFGLGLCFVGNLLNDAGHVLHKKFTTNFVHRRVSPRVIETVDQKFYELVGNLKDTKHVIPKELSNQCRYGCPSRMEQFCKMWKSLQVNSVKPAKHVKETLESSMNAVSVTVSSKGRRIIPPLSYWTGERVVLKGDNTIYDPGASKSPTESTTVENSKRTKLSECTMKPQNDVDSRSKFNGMISKHKTQSNHGAPTALRSREAGNTELNTPGRESFESTERDYRQPSENRYRDLTCTYYKNIRCKDDLLSDDQVSHV